MNVDKFKRLADFVCLDEYIHSCFLFTLNGGREGRGGEGRGGEGRGREGTGGEGRRVNKLLNTSNLKVFRARSLRSISSACLISTYL